MDFITNYLKRDIPNFVFLRTYQIILTDNCNLRCNYCFQHYKSKNTDMSFELGKEIIDKICQIENGINDGKQFRIYFFGGEPFLNSSLLRKLVEYTYLVYPSLPFVFSTTTNGTIIDENIESLAKYKDRFNLIVSLDGNEQINDLNRGQYKIVVKNLELLKQLGFNLQVSSTITPNTVNFMFDSFYHIVEELGVNRFRYTLELNNGIWLTEEMITTTNQQIEKMGNYLMTNDNYNRVKLFNFNYFNFQPMSNKYILCRHLDEGISFDFKGNAYNCFSLKNLNNSEDYTLGTTKTDLKPNEIVKKLNDIRFTEGFSDCEECQISSGCVRCPINDKGNQFHCEIHKAELFTFKKILTHFYKKG